MPTARVNRALSGDKCRSVCKHFAKIDPDGAKSRFSARKCGCDDIGTMDIGRRQDFFTKKPVLPPANYLECAVTLRDGAPHYVSHCVVLRAARPARGVASSAAAAGPGRCLPHWRHDHDPCVRSAQQGARRTRQSFKSCQSLNDRLPRSTRATIGSLPFTADPRDPSSRSVTRLRVTASDAGARSSGRSCSGSRASSRRWPQSAR